jgi:FKBP-type peptidyl-prolyl cis-trans isomerase
MRQFTTFALAAGLLLSMAACGRASRTESADNTAETSFPADTLHYSVADHALLDSIDLLKGVQKTGSGLRYLVVKPGDGVRPAETDTIVVGYRGMHADGSLFWEDAHEAFVLKGTIKGFCEGVGMMPVGASYVLYIPSQLAYGTKGYPDLIAPDEPLIYEVTLQEVIPATSVPDELPKGSSAAK